MSLDAFLLTGSLLVIAAILSTRLAQRAGVPALIIFVAIGMLAGSGGPGGIEFADYGLALDLGLVALAIILLSGGLDTQLSLFKAALPAAAMLSTAGVVIQMALIGLAAWAVTPLTLPEGLLLGAILAPTDAAAVFSVLKGGGLPPRVRGIVEVESGTNDPVGVYLTIGLTALLTTRQFDLVNLVLGLAAKLLIGGLVGCVWGFAFTWLVNRVRVAGVGLYPLLVLAGGLCAYAAAELVHGSGFLAIYVVGLIIANRDIPYRQNVVDFIDALAWGAQISMFLLLGLLVFPEKLMSIVPMALLITFAMIFIARPISVYLPLALFRPATGSRGFTHAERIALSWSGLKGAVPIILAIIPLMNGVERSGLIFNIVFVVVVVSTALQGYTVTPLARRLGLVPHRRDPPSTTTR